MNGELVFHGTPDDWWEQAERIKQSEAEERTLGNWYISKIRQRHASSDGGNAHYRVGTPSRPPNDLRRAKLAGSGDKEAENVRLLIRSAEPVPAWVTSEFIMAEVPGGGAERVPWVRKNNGRWTVISDGRVSVNDHTMEELNPRPAFISEDLI